MTKYASASINQWNFHVTYEDFIDDLYLTYLFNPIGFSILDVSLFGSYVNSELKRPNSLLRHMLQQGLVRAHVRHFEELNVTQLSKKSRDPRGGGFFQTLHTSFRKMGANFEFDKSLENALMLDDLEFRDGFLRFWPLQPDGSRIETSQDLERLINRIISPEFTTSILSRIEGHPHLEATLADFGRIQEFISKLIEPQREYHANASGLLVSSMIKAIADLYKVPAAASAHEVLAALSKSGNLEAVEITKNSLMVVIDRHNKNISNFLGVGYSNPKSTFLTNLIAVGDEKGDEGGSHSITMTVSVPDPRRFQNMTIEELDRVLSACEFTNYASAFNAWNDRPDDANVQGVIRALKSFEQKLKEKYSGEARQKYKASFWHGLGKTAWENLVLCHIEAHGDPLKTGIGVVTKIARSMPGPVTTFVTETVFGNPVKGAVRATTEVLRDKKYEQFALYPEVSTQRTRFVSLHRNLARN